MTTAERGYQWWCEDDYRRLFEAIAAGMSEEEIAEHTRRQPGGVRARAHMLVSYATPKAKALDMLRRLVAEPGFEWEPMVRLVHQQEGLHYWDTDSDAALITAWGAQDPPRMRQLCDQLGVSEERIAMRCMTLDLAGSRVEVVDRFGADSHGALYRNAMMSRDKLSAAVWVLVLTGGDGQVLHLSTHPGHAAAAAACHSLAQTRFAATPVSWTIAMRVCGEGSVRDTDTGPWDELPPLGTDASEGFAPMSPARWWARLRRGAGWDR